MLLTVDQRRQQLEMAQARQREDVTLHTDLDAWNVTECHLVLFTSTFVRAHKELECRFVSLPCAACYALPSSKAFRVSYVS